jgi:hypothetical protein
MVVKDPTAADLDLIRDQFNPDRIYVVLNWHEELKRKMAEAEQ